MGTTRLLALFVLLVALSLVGCTLPSTPPAQQSTAAALASTSTTQPAPASTTTMPQPSPTTMPALDLCQPTGDTRHRLCQSRCHARARLCEPAGHARDRLCQPALPHPDSPAALPWPRRYRRPAPAPLATPSASSAPGVYSPISQTQCNGLKDLVTQTLGRPAAASQAPFRDPVSGAGGHRLRDHGDRHRQGLRQLPRRHGRAQSATQGARLDRRPRRPGRSGRPARRRSCARAIPWPWSASTGSHPPTPTVPKTGRSAPARSSPSSSSTRSRSTWPSEQRREQGCGSYF